MTRKIIAKTVFLYHHVPTDNVRMAVLFPRRNFNFQLTASLCFKKTSANNKYDKIFYLFLKLKDVKCIKIQYRVLKWQFPLTIYLFFLAYVFDNNTNIVSVGTEVKLARTHIHRLILNKPVDMMLGTVLRCRHFKYVRCT